MPRGKGLGGTSSINDAFLARGNPKDFDQWADLGDIGWSFEDCLPYFKKTEKVTFPVKAEDRDYHGFEGMQSASIPEDTPKLVKSKPNYHFSKQYITISFRLAHLLARLKNWVTNMWITTVKPNMV